MKRLTHYFRLGIALALMCLIAVNLATAFNGIEVVNNTFNILAFLLMVTALVIIDGGITKKASW